MSHGGRARVKLTPTFWSAARRRFRLDDSRPNQLLVSWPPPDHWMGRWSRSAIRLGVLRRWGLRRLQFEFRPQADDACSLKASYVHVPTHRALYRYLLLSATCAMIRCLCFNDSWMPGLTVDRFELVLSTALWLRLCRLLLLKLLLHYCIPGRTTAA